MSVTSELNRVQFVAEDFATYRAEAEAYYQAKYPNDFNNLIATDLGNALIDQLAFAMQALTFSMNRRASENFLSTARLSSSVTKLARMLGYAISPATPATVDAPFVIENGPFNFPIPIQQGFKIQGPGTIVYQYAGLVPFVIPANAVSGVIPLTEGQSKTLTFTSDGTENQSLRITGIPEGQFLYSDGMLVLVDGVEWTRQDLLTYDSENIFEVLFSNNPPLVNFGDGVLGNIPPEGAQIAITYSFGQGLIGSIGSNQLAAPVAPLVVQGQTINLSFTNPVSNVGSDPEDIRHVKAFASAFFRTQNAAVVKSDYDTIALLESGVVAADAQIMRGVSGDVTLQSYFQYLNDGVAAFKAGAEIITSSTVTGVDSVGVSGTNGLTVGGLDSLFVDGLLGIGVSGLSFLGWNGSFVTGTEYLGVSGTGSVIVGGTSGLFVDNISEVGVSGLSMLGVSDSSDALLFVQSASGNFEFAVDGMKSYLSQVFSDTSKANNVQVVVLSVDTNNNYIAPSSTTISNVQQRLQTIADAVVTVTVVDGSGLIVKPDIVIDVGLTPTANENEVIQNITKALTQSVFPYGTLVRRQVGASLYISDMVDSIREIVTKADAVHVNPKITNLSEMLDIDGNLIIQKQQVIQANTFKVNIVKRFARNEVY